MNTETLDLALRLADQLDEVPEHGADPDLIERSSAELRRLHAENLQLRADLEAIGAGGVGPLISAPQPKPQGEQEPVAWAVMQDGAICWEADYPFSNEPGWCDSDQQSVPLYTHLQPASQPLTHQVIQELADEGVFHANVFEIVRRIEEKHEIFKLRAIENGGDA